MTASIPAMRLSHRITLGPTTRFVRSLPLREVYLLREVAGALDVSDRVLRRLMAQRPELAPSHSLMRGSIRVWLYTPQDVERLRSYFADSTDPLPPTSQRTGGNAGRPVLWTPTESVLRARAHRRRYYWHTRARQLTGRGDLAGAARASATAEEIDRALWEQYNRRATHIYGF